MTKVTLTDLSNLQNENTAVSAINANNAAVETAFDNTLSRDGTAPNTMGAAIDMNNNQIYNLPAPSTVNSPARLVDVVTNPTITVPGTGTSGHTVPFLDGNNTWSGTNGFTSTTNSGTLAVTGVATFTAAPVGPTAAADTNTTALATTAFVIGQASSTTPAANTTAAVGTSKKYARADHAHDADATKSAITRTINAQSGTTYTFVLGDSGNVVTGSNASATAFTIPLNASVAFPVGAQIDLVQTGAGKITVGGSPTINSVNSFKSISAQYASASLLKTATDTWLLMGSLIA